MNKIFTILLLPVLLSAGTLGLTGRFGMNLSGTVGKDAKIIGYSRSPEPGIVGGVGVDYLFHKLGIGTELLYSQKGVRYMQADNVGIVANLNYLETALFALYEVPVQDITIRSLFGLAPSFLLESSAENHMGGESSPQELRGISDFDLGVVAGIALGRTLEIGSLFFDLRGTLGMLTNDSSGNESDYNGVLSLSILFRFPIALENK